MEMTWPRFALVAGGGGDPVCELLRSSSSAEWSHVEMPAGEAGVLSSLASLRWRR